MPDGVRRLRTAAFAHWEDTPMLGSSHRRRRGAEHISVNPLFAQGSVLAPIPARRMPAGEMSSAAAYQKAGYGYMNSARRSQ